MESDPVTEAAASDHNKSSPPIEVGICSPSGVGGQSDLNLNLMGISRPESGSKW